MRIRISEPRLLPELLESLRRGDCRALPLDDTTCEVVHEDAENEREARVELIFFLRAWSGAHPGSRAELLT